MVQPVDFLGATIWPGALDPDAQRQLVDEVRAVAQAAPMRRFETRGGRRMSVAMTSAGDFGWVSDRQGYRYQPATPDGHPWPAIPAQALALWRRLLPEARAPECCLINYYDGQARMGLHQDRDEGDFDQPVLSISLGDAARFRLGGTRRDAPTKSVWLASGDVVVLAGASRLAFHGIDSVRAGSSTLLRNGGRLNLTLRVVTPAEASGARSS